MANRAWDRLSQQLERGVVRLYAQITFGASGAPTLVTANSKGFVSVVRVSAGKYTITLGTIHPGSVPALDTYHSLLTLGTLWDATGNSGTAPAAPLVVVTANNIAVAGSASFQITCMNSSGTATDPASGEKVYIKFETRLSKDAY